MGRDNPTVADGVAASLSSSTVTDISGRVLRGRYRATRPVGSGSMGDVYEAVDLTTTERLALKVLKPERAVREVFRHRFLREAKSAVLIDHPNVVDVIDYGETDDGLLFIAMEFLEGEDLASYLERVGPLGWDHAIIILRQVAAALAAAHDRGVVHRDIKPSNILLRDAGPDALLVKLVDFGVAKLDSHLVSRILTKAADVVGTVLYMSPEQAEGRGADLRSDVYSFGATAFQMITGHVPFPGRDLFKVMTAHMTLPAPDPREIAPDLGPAARAFILRCLEKDPDARYQSMHDVLAVMAGVAPADMQSRARPGTPVTPFPRELDQQHPPLAEDSVVADPFAHPESGRQVSVPVEDDFEDGPTAHFRPGQQRSSPNDPPGALAASPSTRVPTERSIAFDPDDGALDRHDRTPVLLYVGVGAGVVVVLVALAWVVGS